MIVAISLAWSSADPLIFIEGYKFAFMNCIWCIQCHLVDITLLELVELREKVICEGELWTLNYKDEVC